MWLERCRDGSYALNALRCECGQSVHAFRCASSLVSLVFEEVFFGGSASLHYLFLHFLAKCFFYNFAYRPAPGAHNDVKSIVVGAGSTHAKD